MMHSLMRALICLCLLPSIIAASLPGTFEIDLIFPRNGTWAPADDMPIVWAIQRPDLSPAFAITWLSWTLSQGSNHQHGQIYFPDFDASDTKPSFIKRTVSNTSGIEGSWYFSWKFEAGNCTSSENPRRLSSGGVAIADPTSYVYTEHRIVSEFNTSKSAPSANWTTLTSAQNCGGSDGVAFAVTDILSTPVDSKWPGFNRSCAVYGPTSTTSNPCAVTINAVAASSVSADLAYQVCVNRVNGTGTGNCTLPTVSSSNNRVTASWLSAAVLCVMGFAIL